MKLCPKCGMELTDEATRCPACGNKANSKAVKKKTLIIVLSSAAAVVLAFCLVLFVPYKTEVDCTKCKNGVMVCRDKEAAEWLSGQKIYGHDCDQCENGYSTCTRCKGKGTIVETVTNVREWF